MLRWRERGWVTADTHVHFLSPQTALLEGQAEGVNVVNLLASQWGEMFSNVGDFDGQTTFGAEDFGGDGEFLVRVGTENRMQVLGHISLLGYRGELIHPLCTGGPGESALGDPLEVTMAEWAQRCIDQGGLVVMPHAPDPQLERAADIVLGSSTPIELMHLQPADPGTRGRRPSSSPYGLADWYRYLNLGYHVPLVGGSDKMAAAALLGGIRTYAQLGERELTYENWMEAVRAGNTFVTVGPLVSLDGRRASRPGGRVDLPAGGGTRDRSSGGRVGARRRSSGSRSSSAATRRRGGRPSADSARRAAAPRCIVSALDLDRAARARQLPRQTRTISPLTPAPCRCSSDGSELFSETDAMAVLDQIQGAIAYVDTIAPRARGAPLPRAARDARDRLQPPAPAHARRGHLPPPPAPRPGAAARALALSELVTAASPTPGGVIRWRRGNGIAALAEIPT